MIRCGATRQLHLNGNIFRVNVVSSQEVLQIIQNHVNMFNRISIFSKTLMEIAWSLIPSGFIKNHYRCLTSDKPLHKPLLTCCKLNTRKYASQWCILKCKYFVSGKCHGRWCSFNHLCVKITVWYPDNDTRSLEAIDAVFWGRNQPFLFGAKQ